MFFGFPWQHGPCLRALWRIDSCKTLPNVLNICRSMRLQSGSSAASDWYLGHTPITARLRDELCRGNIFMEWSHFFECYFGLILRPRPGVSCAEQSGSGSKMTSRVAGRLSSLYANALGPRLLLLLALTLDDNTLCTMAADLWTLGWNNFSIPVRTHKIQQWLEEFNTGVLQQAKQLCRPDF